METQAFGQIVRDGAWLEGRLQRSYSHPAEQVWAQLTEPAALAQWLAPGILELHEGGAVRIDFGDSGIVIDSTLTAFVPGQMLEYSWSSGAQPQRPLRWELQSHAAGAVLALTVRVPADEDIAKACAGFEAHLEMLAAALEGVSIKFPFDLYVQARKAYSEQMAQLG